MNDPTEQVRYLLADLGSPREAIRYIDGHLSAEGRANYSEAKAILVRMNDHPKPTGESE